MAISRFSTSSVAQGLPKYQEFWDNTTVLFDSDYELIDRVTLSTSATSISFSSIPSTYKHLQLRMLLRADRSGGDDLKVNFNGDTGGNYANHILGGDGSSAFQYAQSSWNFIYSYQGIPGAGTTSGLFYGGIMDILDYKNTNKTKVVRWFQGYDNNGGGNIELTSGLWNNTSAISSITVAPRYGTNFVQYSQIALYGIRGIS